nr:hypothetical protein [Actinomycetales bacterium]
MYQREPDPDYPEAAPRGVPPWELEEAEHTGPRRSNGARLLAGVTAAAMILVIVVPAFVMLQTRLSPVNSMAFLALVGLAAAGLVQVLRRRRE